MFEGWQCVNLTVQARCHHLLQQTPCFPLPLLNLKTEKPSFKAVLLCGVEDTTNYRHRKYSLPNTIPLLITAACCSVKRNTKIRICELAKISISEYHLQSYLMMQ